MKHIHQRKVIAYQFTMHISLQVDMFIGSNICNQIYKSYKCKLFVLHLNSKVMVSIASGACLQGDGNEGTVVSREVGYGGYAKQVPGLE